MRTPMRRVLLGSAIAGGFTVLGIALSATAASADEPGSTSGQDGIVSGNQTGLTVTAPVDTSGNQVTVIGTDNTNESSGNTSTGSMGGNGGATTTGQDGTGSGNQTDAPVTAPVDASGNQVTVIGSGNVNQPEDTPGDGTEPGDGDDGDDVGSQEPGGTESGGPASYPSSGPQGGTTVTTAQGLLPTGPSGRVVLPETGTDGGLRTWALAGLVLLAAGLLLTRRAPARRTTR